MHFIDLLIQKWFVSNLSLFRGRHPTSLS